VEQLPQTASPGSATKLDTHLCCLFLSTCVLQCCRKCL